MEERYYGTEGSIVGLKDDGKHTHTNKYLVSSRTNVIF